MGLFAHHVYSSVGEDVGPVSRHSHHRHAEVHPEHTMKYVYTYSNSTVLTATMTTLRFILNTQ